MANKVCALCSHDIDTVEEPALLFIGKYGRRYEICPDCEALMDTLVSTEDEAEKTAAAKTVYHHLFEGDEQKSGELITFFRDLLAENSETMTEAKESLEEYEEEERRKKEEALTEKDEVKTEPSEEEFLQSEEKPMKLWVRLVFLLLFLLLGGGALAFGILSSRIAMAVVGGIVILVGIATVFSKD